MESERKPEIVPVDEVADRKLADGNTAVLQETESLPADKRKVLTDNLEIIVREAHYHKYHDTQGMALFNTVRAFEALDAELSYFLSIDRFRAIVAEYMNVHPDVFRHKLSL